MIERTQDRFGRRPERLAADGACGLAENLARPVHDRGIEPHIPVFDKSERHDGTFERTDFIYGHRRDLCIYGHRRDLCTCPGGRELRHYRSRFKSARHDIDENGPIRYRAGKLDCDACHLKQRCCPIAPVRKILLKREGARDMARGAEPAVAGPLVPVAGSPTTSAGIRH